MNFTKPKTILASLLVIALTIQLGNGSARGDELDDAWNLYYSGEYEECARECSNAIAAGAFSQDWPVLQIHAAMATGDYDEALAALDTGLNRHPKSIRIRIAGIDVCRFNNLTDRSFEIEREIEKLYSRSPWQYRDGVNQVAIGEYFLSKGIDAKQILDDYFSEIKKNQPRLVDSFLAIARLGLNKNDFALAAENFRKALEIQENNPEIYFGLAQALERSDFAASTEALDKALELNPRHVPSLLARADNLIDGEVYASASKILDSTLEINPHEPLAWSYKAVIAHLKNQPNEEIKCRKKALAKWKYNPQVDYLIGKKLAGKYRFKEAESYQRRALVFNENYLPSQIQLAQDLLRLGKESDGWQLAETVYDADRYNVVAHNLVLLRDQLEKYETIKRENFVVRMDPFEAQVYGDRVAKLLSRASDVLETKYKIQIRTPVIVEVFARQQDFAIRTFGTPGGDGFLGVCFGNVVTMNSPAAQGNSLTSWESVLWHEFCHVVTLQKTENKMPRWLSEGISVYEERLANSSWGQSMNLQYQEMILGEDLTPVSELSNAFLKPDSAMHLQFAYFQSSLVVQYIIEKKGIDVLIRVLDDLRVGMPINDSLERYMGSMKLFEKEFEDYAKGLANQLTAKGDWSEPEFTAETSAETILEFVKDNPDNVEGLKIQLARLIESKNWKPAESVCQRLLEFGFNFPGASNPHWQLSEIYRSMNDKAKEKQALQNYLKIDSDNLQPILRLMEMARNEEDWKATAKYAEQYFAVNPLIPVPHRYMAEAAMQTNDFDAAIQSLNALAKMDPLDPAELYFQLATAYLAKDEINQAKRSILMSIEEAPRFQKAHALYREILNQSQGSITGIERAKNQNDKTSTEKR